MVVLSRLIWIPLKLVPPGTYFSEIIRPTLKNLFPMGLLVREGKLARVCSHEGAMVESTHVRVVGLSVF